MVISPRMTPEILSTVFQLRDHLQAAAEPRQSPLNAFQPTVRSCGGLKSRAGIWSTGSSQRLLGSLASGISLLLTWHGLQPVRFHQQGVSWLHKCTCCPDGWPSLSWLVILLWQLNLFEPFNHSFTRPVTRTVCDKTHFFIPKST